MARKSRPWTPYVAHCDMGGLCSEKFRHTASHTPISYERSEDPGRHDHKPPSTASLAIGQRTLNESIDPFARALWDVIDEAINLPGRGITFLKSSMIDGTPLNVIDHQGYRCSFACNLVSLPCGFDVACEWNMQDNTDCYIWWWDQRHRDGGFSGDPKLGYHYYFDVSPVGDQVRTIDLEIGLDDVVKKTTHSSVVVVRERPSGRSPAHLRSVVHIHGLWVWVSKPIRNCYVKPCCDIIVSMWDCWMGKEWVDPADWRDGPQLSRNGTTHVWGWRKYWYLGMTSCIRGIGSDLGLSLCG